MTVLSTPKALEPFTPHKSMLLTTFRADGGRVVTPVSVAVEGNRAFFRTFASAGKAKRLRHNPDLEMRPASARGRPLEPTVRGRARLLGGDEAQHAAHALARTHPILQRVLVPLAHRWRGHETQHYEVTITAPADEDDAPPRR